MGVFIRGWSSTRVVSTHWTSVVFLPPTTEPLTIADVKARARIPTPDEDGLILAYLKAARVQVELDTGLALLTQTRDVYADVLTGSPMTLPPQSTPLQSVTSVKTTDAAGTVNTLNPLNYTVDLSSGRISISETGEWPSDLRAFQPWVIRIVSGWTSAALIPPLLVECVGLLATHMMTEGRDRFTAANLRDEYEEKIAPYRPVVVA